MRLAYSERSRTIGGKRNLYIWHFMLKTSAF